MKKISKIIGTICLIIIIVCGVSWFTDKTQYTTNWSIKNINPDSSGISWAKFEWSNDSLGGKYLERTAMFIPCKIEGLPYNFTFQFDLGIGATEINQNSINSFLKGNPALSKRIKNLKSPLQFWNSRKRFNDLAINFGNVKATTENGFLKKDYGDKYDVSEIPGNTVYPIGSIGADMFQNKILIIDYPKQRFGICDTLPGSYKTSFSNIELDKAGRVILPMQLKGKNYNVLFDNGSSLFALLVADSRINEFSTAPDIDTLKINSWGVKHDVTGRLIQDSFQLAGHTFSRVEVFADYRKNMRSAGFDAITGNILFWDKTVVIDFKHKKFGIK